jgi:hypothetical protein
VKPERRKTSAVPVAVANRQSESTAETT